MMHGPKSYVYKTGGLIFNIVLEHPLFKLDSSGGSHRFLVQDHVENSTDYLISFSIAPEINQPDTTPQFQGKSFGDNQIPYNWSVYKIDTHDLLLLSFENDSQITSLSIAFLLDQKTVLIKVKPKLFSTEIRLDPFFHPLGPIILQYIIQQNKGILIHASGVKDQQQGYVFTAVSGTGKSTMAKLWQQKGALIINDDRLVLASVGERIMMSNTPMPYYQDIYKTSDVNAIFLIKQATSNFIKPLSPAIAMAKMMANCIQFLYDQEMVKEHLKSIHAIAEKCAIFELGFTPTTDIVDLVRREFRKQ